MTLASSKVLSGSFVNQPTKPLTGELTTWCLWRPHKGTPKINPAKAPGSQREQLLKDLKTGKRAIGTLKNNSHWLDESGGDADTTGCCSSEDAEPGLSD